MRIWRLQFPQLADFHQAAFTQGCGEIGVCPRGRARVRARVGVDRCVCVRRCL